MSNKIRIKFLPNFETRNAVSDDVKLDLMPAQFKFREMEMTFLETGFTLSRMSKRECSLYKLVL